MKAKDIYEGQKVALARNPQVLLGKVIVIKKNGVVEVELGGGQVILYGARALVAYKQKGES